MKEEVGLTLCNQWKKDMKIIGLFTLVILSLVLVACSMAWLKNYPQDNIVEEVVEELIENEAGLNIDLSPLTPEQ